MLQAKVSGSDLPSLLRGRCVEPASPECPRPWAGESRVDSHATVGALQARVETSRILKYVRQASACRYLRQSILQSWSFSTNFSLSFLSPIVSFCQPRQTEVR